MRATKRVNANGLGDSFITLGRAKQMYKNHIALIDDLRQELVVNHSEEGELLQFLRVIVRWTTLRTRED